MFIEQLIWYLMIALITRIINGGHILIEQQSFNCKLIANVDRSFKHFVHHLHPSFAFIPNYSRRIPIITFSLIAECRDIYRQLKGLYCFKPDIKIFIVQGTLCLKSVSACRDNSNNAIILIKGSVWTLLDILPSLNDQYPEL